MIGWDWISFHFWRIKTNIQFPFSSCPGRRRHSIEQAGEGPIPRQE
jgi:hypothetical protein